MGDSDAAPNKGGNAPRESGRGTGEGGTPEATDVGRDAAGRFERTHCLFTDVTERSRLEAALKESSERLVMALEAARAGIWEWDPQTGESQWSDQVWDLLGLDKTTAQHTQKAWQMAVHPEDRSAAEAAFLAAQADGSAITAEWRTALPRDRERWMLSVGRPVLDPDGGVQRYRGILLDVTDRKNVERRLAATLDSIGDGVLSFDADWRYLYVNPCAERLLGMRREILLGKVCWDVFPVLVGTFFETECRRTAAGEPFVTDGGHLILDAFFGRISQPEALSGALLDIPGVVQHGLFLNMCNKAYVAGPDGVRTLVANETRTGS